MSIVNLSLLSALANLNLSCVLLNIKTIKYAPIKYVHILVT